MYVKLKDGIVDKYPYHVYDLMADNRNTSFPAEMPNERLAEWGMYEVVETMPPPISDNEELVELTPIFDGKNWVQTWSIKTIG